MSDLISRRDAINEIKNVFDDVLCCNVSVRKGLPEAVRRIEMMPSAEPREYGVLCALADRECPFQGKEFAWCLTCPHISEEDRDLVKKAVAEPKTGTWIFNPKDAIESMFTKPKCSECGFESSDGGNFCSNCGADMRGGEDE